MRNSIKNLTMEWLMYAGLYIIEILIALFNKEDKWIVV